jgi:hypothetical protein
VQSCIPDGDLPSRWSGNQFLILGIGQATPESTFMGALETAIVDSGVALGKRPVMLRLSVANGDPQDTTLEALVAEATRRGHATRAPTPPGT